MSSNPVAAIIGVGPGIGRSVALKFAKEGYSVALIARTQAKLDPVKLEIEKLPNGRALAIAADGTDQKQVSEAFDRIRKELGHPTVLVYNAGSFKMGSILDLKPEDFQNVFQSSVIGALLASKEVLPNMKKEAKGTIIYTGATAALRGGINFSAFAAGKFGLRAFAQSAAREFGPQGVHVIHTIIDAGVGKDDPKKSDPEGIAQIYWDLHKQPQSTWTQEIDVRPHGEKW